MTGVRVCRGEGGEEAKSNSGGLHFERVDFFKYAWVRWW